jgi:CheY-like chemotaxis protein
MQAPDNQAAQDRSQHVILPAHLVTADSPRAASRARARRILIAEDNADSMECLAVLLKLEGHDVACARDGESAWRLFQAFEPDTVILDISMPLLSGHEVARKIRQEPGMAGVLLIAVSGWARESDRQESFAAGFDQHLAKPLDISVLTRMLV